MAEKRTDVFRENPIFLTTRAALALAARCRRALKDRGVADVSPAQLAILASLDAKDGQTPTELARSAKYEKSSLTPMVDKLEKAGLVLRVKDPKDGRLQHLYLSKKGRKRRKEVEAILDEVTRELFEGLSRKTLKHHAAFCEAVLGGEASADEED
ncbi:MAG: MarR family transcriptional regulator [Polyangiales bacterium]